MSEWILSRFTDYWDHPAGGEVANGAGVRKVGYPPTIVVVAVPFFLKEGMAPTKPPPSSRVRMQPESGQDHAHGVYAIGESPHRTRQRLLNSCQTRSQCKRTVRRAGTVILRPHS